MEYSKSNSDTLKESMLAAMEKTLCIVTTACKLVGIARQTHYRWMDEDEDYNKAINDVNGTVLDFAESQLHKQIRSNNTTATIFYLKTKGKKRGYVETQEITSKISHDFSGKTNEEIDKEIEAEKAKHE